VATPLAAETSSGCCSPFWFEFPLMRVNPQNDLRVAAPILGAIQIDSDRQQPRLGLNVGRKTVCGLSPLVILICRRQK
jgi:hypothetical protein